jgi:hypothetical protein
MERDTDKVLIIPQIFGGTPTRKEYPEILLGLDVSEGNVRLNGITLEFPRNFTVPVRRHLVENHMVSLLFRTSYYRLKAVLLQTVIRI